MPVDTIPPAERDPLSMSGAEFYASEVDTKALQQENADVKKWLARIKEGRDFDKAQRREYAINRDYCRGTAGTGTFRVKVNIAGTYTELVTALLFASNPQPQVTPADSCGPSRLKNARELAKPLEIVVAHLWAKAKLKRAGKQQTRSMSTIGVGWIKATWQERMGQDPIVAQRIADAQDNLRRLQEEQQELLRGGCEFERDYDSEMAEINNTITGLQGRLEVVKSRGLVSDFVRGEDIQVAPSVDCISNYTDAPWIAHRTFMDYEDACDAYPDAKDALRKAKRYYPVKPSDGRDVVEAGPLATLARNEDDADSHTTGANPSSTSGEVNRSSIAVWEIWDAATMTVITTAEGMDRYLVKPYAPQPATTRFYPFFLFGPIEVDGDRHPHSLVGRTRDVLDEYNRTRSNFSEHRARTLPKTGFDTRAVTPDDATKLERGGIQEMVGITPVGNNTLAGSLQEINYAKIDMALYDTAAIRADLEMVWGIQEALGSSIHTAKTLGEAEIQQTGTQARNDFKRDALDEMLGELATYTAEIAIQKLTYEDVAKIAGPEALWPENVDVEELAMLVNVNIKAGSSGRPDTTAERQAWGLLSAQLEKALTNYAALVNANPLDTAKCIHNMVEETLRRFGEHVDADEFLPQPGQPMQLVDPKTGQVVMAFPAPNQPPPQPMPPPGALPGVMPPPANDPAVQPMPASAGANAMPPGAMPQ